ncbi:hypothetical protein [Peribacillus simplex]|uniref:Uncharacterized protein n=1 Tax=Peribacillus simplex TaxID=1478 RepID=A0A9W4P955_9BACI|nr:hypothetical protein SRABI133_00307 [Peribacillus simplex]
MVPLELLFKIKNKIINGKEDNAGTSSTTKTQTTWNMDKTVKYTGLAVVYTYTDAYVQVATKTGTLINKHFKEWKTLHSINIVNGIIDIIILVVVVFIIVKIVKTVNRKYKKKK